MFGVCKNFIHPFVDARSLTNQKRMRVMALTMQCAYTSTYYADINYCSVYMAILAVISAKLEYALKTRADT